MQLLSSTADERLPRCPANVDPAPAGRTHRCRSTPSCFWPPTPAEPTGARSIEKRRAIRAELKRSGYRDRFELVTRWAAEPLDLLRELRELRPAVVHFSGHGGEDGLFFQAADGARPGRLARSDRGDVRRRGCLGQAGRPERVLQRGTGRGVARARRLRRRDERRAPRRHGAGLRDRLLRRPRRAASRSRRRTGTGTPRSAWRGCPTIDRPQLKVRAGCDAAQLVLAAVTAASAVHVALPCPYPGMRPYSADDADHFHGRGAEIDELLGRLRAGEREIYVIGPSGSGKSSLVAAGVLPRLARGAAGLGPVRRPIDAPRRASGRAAGRAARGLRPKARHASGRHRRAPRGPRPRLVGADLDRSARGAVHAGGRRRARPVPARARGPAGRAPLRGRLHAARRLLRRLHGEPAVDGSAEAGSRASRWAPLRGEALQRGDRATGARSSGSASSPS